MKRVFAFFLVLGALFLIRPAGIRAEGRSLTLMVYMCGSNLESGSGAATADIQEMKDACPVGGDVSILVMTGGSETGGASGYFSDEAVKIHEIAAGRSRCVWESDSAMNMGNPETLTQLICFGAENYPAQDYALILWNHGGGPMEGLCWDELFSMDNLSLAEMEAGLRAANMEKKLSWIGFDACLMSSVEVASACAPFADYMIASQETEPGSGWDYSFLEQIPACPDGKETGKQIAEKYAAGFADAGTELTIACIDLRRIPDVEEAMNDLFLRLDGLLTPDAFSLLSNRRRDAKAFGRATTASEYDLVDLYSLSDQYQPEAPGSVQALHSALTEAVICHLGNQENSHGLSVYFPYFNKDYYTEKWKDSYAALDFSAQYHQFLSHYTDIWLGGALTDWSDIRAEGMPPRTDSQEITLALSPEQMEHFAYAQVYVLSEMSFNDPYFYKIYEMDDPVMDEDGTLHAEYNYKALYVLDGNGNPLSRPVPYRIVDNTYLIRVSLDDESLVERLRRITADPHQDLELRSEQVYLRCVRNESTDELEVIGIIEADGSAGVEASDNKALYMGKPTLDLDTDWVNWISFIYFPRKMTAAADSRLLPYTQWTDPQLSEEEGIDKPFGADEINNRQSWKLKFCEAQYTGMNLYAQYLIHDTQGNTAASDLIPIANPTRTEISRQNNVLMDEDGLFLKLAGIEISNAEINQGLFIRFEADSQTSATLREATVKNLRLGTCGIHKTFQLKETINAEGAPDYTLRLIPDQWPDELANEIDGIDFDLVLGDKSYPVHIEQRIDLSPIRSMRAADTPLANTQVGSLRYELLEIQNPEPDKLTLRLRITNLSDALQSVSLRSHILINRCWCPDTASGAYLDIPPRSWMIQEIKLSTLSQSNPFQSHVEDYIPEQYDYLERWGLQDIQSLCFFNLDSANEIPILLRLEKPYPLQRPAGERSTAAEPSEILFEDAGFSLRPRRIYTSGKDVYLILEADNTASKPVELYLHSPEINGKPWTSRISELNDHHVNFWITETIRPDCRTDLLCKLSCETEDASENPPESIRLCFGYTIGSNGSRQFSSPVTVHVPTADSGNQILWNAPEGTPLVIESSGILPEYNNPSPADLIDIALEDSADFLQEDTLLDIPLTEEEKEAFDRVRIIFFTNPQDLQYIASWNQPAILRDEASGRISCRFSGALVCMNMNIGIFPVFQEIFSPRPGLCQYKLKNAVLSTNDEDDMAGIDVFPFTILLDQQNRSFKISRIAFSRKLSNLETIIRQKYYSILYRVAGPEGSVPEMTSTLVGHYEDVPDGKMHLILYSAEKINPYVLFIITNKDGTEYIKGEYYQALQHDK